MTGEELARALAARRTGDQWIARCPAHDDRSPSLAIRETGGRLLLRCHAGCTYEAVRDALQARGLQLTGAGGDQGWETVYTVRDAQGRAVAQHVRIDRADGKRVFWRGPAGERVGLNDLGIRVVDMPLYGVERLAGTSATRPVVICEGEKAATALSTLDVLALGTTCGASATPSRAALDPLRGRPVYLWPDNDEPGRVHMQRIAAALHGLGVTSYTLAWPEAPAHGDAHDWIYRSNGTREDFARMATAARAAHAEQPDPARALGVRRLFEGVREANRRLDAFDAGDFSDLVQTGIEGLDRRLEGGLRGGEVTLIGAPAKGGKTTLVQQIVSHAAERGAVLLVTPEMGLPALAEREIVRRSGSRKWERRPWGHVPTVLKEHARNAHVVASSRIMNEQRPLYILDKRDATMSDVEAAAAAVPGLRLIAIDYAQQVAGEADARTPRYLQVGEVGTRSVMLAERLNVPVIVASQVNVSKEGRQTTYTFRETSILEHKAHNVLVLEVEWSEDAGTRTVVSAHIVCTRSRSTAAFRLEVDFQPGLYRLSDMAGGEAEQTSIPGGA